MEMELGQLHSILNAFKLSFIDNFPKIFFTTLWLIFLFAIIKPVRNAIIKGLELVFEKNRVDPLLRSFLLSFANIAVYGLFFFMIISELGVKTTSLVTLVGTAGIAVGLALQGSLSNLAGGVLILLFKPFSKGDFIVTSSGNGTVESIYILYTVIQTLDNSRVIIPNGSLSNAPITNVSRNEERMLDLIFSVSYDSDIDQVKELLTKVAEDHANILHHKGYTIRLKTHNASSLDFVFRAWVKNTDYWSTYYDMMENTKKVFDANNIEIPYNKLDIYQR